MALRVLRMGLCAAMAVSCGDPVVPPWPEPPAIPLRPRVIEEWEAARPQRVQRGVFTYDDNGHLSRYTFGLVQPDGSQYTTLYVDYTYAAERLVSTETFVRDGDAFRLVRESAIEYGTAGLPTRRVTRSLSETSGEIQEFSETYQYDSSRRLSAIVRPQGREQLTYDSRDNVVRIDNYDNGTLTLVIDNTFEPSFSPFPAMRVYYEGIILNTGMALGPYNVSGWTARAPNAPPASRITITSELNEQGYPVRKEMRAVNTSDPDNPHILITTFDYTP